MPLPGQTSSIGTLPMMILNMQNVGATPSLVHGELKDACGTSPAGRIGILGQA